MLLEGIFLPLTTPFHSDGRLFLRKLEANVARYSLTPASGLLVGASESDALSDKETGALLGAAMQTAMAEKVMLAAVGRDSLARTLALAECAACDGYDAVTVGIPRIGDESEHRNYLLMVADRSALPVVLDHVPGEFARQLAAHSNVLGALGNNVTELVAAGAGTTREVTVTSTFQAVTGRMLQRASGLVQLGSAGGDKAGNGTIPLKTRQKKVPFQVLGSATTDMLAGWRAGACGAVPHLGSCAPQACCEVWQAYRDGDDPLADEKQERILDAGRIMQEVAPLKYGCDVNGYYGGPPRLPRFAADGELRGAVERALSGLKT